MVDYWNHWEFPDADWQTATPSELGLDEEILLQGLDYIAEKKIKVYSLLVVRNNKILSEWYGINPYDETPCNPYTSHCIHSCTKSITSALIGIAIQQKLIKSIDEPIFQYFTDLNIKNLTKEKRTITIADLLTMRSGLEWGESDVEEEDFMNSPVPVKYVLDQKIKYPPGKVFNYSSGHVHILASILHRVTGRTPLEYANENLFHPLGIFGTQWLADPQGTNYGCFGISLTTRNLAKFASLYLSGGIWNGKQIIPSKWIKISLTPHTQSNWTKEKMGYLWWLPTPSMAAIVGAWGQNSYIIHPHNMIVSYNAKMTFESLGNNLATFTHKFVCNAIKN